MVRKIQISMSFEGPLRSFIHVELLPVKFSFRAVQQDNLDICTILVNALCDLEAKTTDGLTALH